MRKGGLIAASILVALGAAAVLVYPRSPALLTQPQFFDATTYDLTSGRDVVQTFTASGTVSGIEAMYTSSDHSGLVRPVEATLFEVESGTEPSDWRERTLARATASVGRFPLRAPLAFRFAPVVLRPGRVYGVRFESDFPADKLVLMRDQVPNASMRGLYQGERGLTGALAFRLDGEGGPGGVYRVLRAGRVRPMIPAAAMVGLLLSLLAVAGLLLAEAPETPASEDVGVRPPRGEGEGPAPELEVPAAEGIGA